MKALILIFLTLLLMSGCGLTKDDDINNDDNTNETLKPIATNCADNVENAYGCYGPTKTFGVGALTIVNGSWSIYTMSTLPVSTQSRYFDVYKYGYEFLDDGIVYKYDATGITILTWGVSSKGDAITISGDGTYTYIGRFNDVNCFEVSNGQIDESIKMCNESSVDLSHKNDAGYYFGQNVTFGNYTHGNYIAVGDWQVISDQIATVTLDSNGTTSNGAQWGVRKDGKSIMIDDKSYLIYKYPNSEDCIETFELSGEIITASQIKLCKQN